jgi:O-antigen/teichoic acid export membrane protein
MGLSQGAFFVLQFCGSVIVARILNPYAMGVYAVAVAIIGVLSTIQAFGLSAFIVREAELDRRLQATTFTINAIISVALAAMVAGLSGVAAKFLHEEGVRRVMLLLAVTPLLGVFEFLPAANLEREARFKVIALVNTSRTAVIQALTVMLAILGFGYMSMAWCQVAASVLSMIIYNLAGRRHVSFRIELADWRRISRFGLNMLAISGVNSIAGRASDFLLGRIVGLGALGLYSRASNLSNLVWENIHLVIGRVIFVDLASQKKAGGSLRESYIRIVDVLTALLWPAFAGLAVVGGPFILAVYGPKWISVAHPLVMLAIGGMVLVAITMTWEVFVICQETDRQVKIEVVRMGAGVAMFTVGCFISLTGAAAARLGEALFSVFLYRPHLDRMTETRTQDFIPIYIRNGLLTLAAIGPAEALMASYGFSERTPLLYVACTIVLGVGVWLGLIFALRHPIAQEIIRLAPASRRIFKAARV